MSKRSRVALLILWMLTLNSTWIDAQPASGEVPMTNPPSTPAPTPTATPTPTGGPLEHGQLRVHFQIGTTTVPPVPEGPPILVSDLAGTLPTVRFRDATRQPLKSEAEPFVPGSYISIPKGAVYFDLSGIKIRLCKVPRDGDKLHPPSYDGLVLSTQSIFRVDYYPPANVPPPRSDAFDSQDFPSNHLFQTREGYEGQIEVGNLEIKGIMLPWFELTPVSQEMARFKLLPDVAAIGSSCVPGSVAPGFERASATLYYPGGTSLERTIRPGVEEWIPAGAAYLDLQVTTAWGALAPNGFPPACLAQLVRPENYTLQYHPTSNGVRVDHQLQTEAGKQERNVVVRRSGNWRIKL